MASTRFGFTPAQRVVQRVVLPDDANPHALPDYIDGSVVRVARDAGPDDPPRVEGRDFTDRYKCIVPAGATTSFASYFNAFPAAYWRRWTDVRHVTLRVRVHGHVTVTVFRSTSKAHYWPVRTFYLNQGETKMLEWRLPLEPFIDGGWYWFDVTAHLSDAWFEGAEWLVDSDGTAPSRLSIAITTYNRPDYCVEQVSNLAQNPEVLRQIDEIFIVDQGNQKVVDADGFERAAASVGNRLKVIDQPNLGGSGGFARGMYESLKSDRSNYLLLLDDDVVTEPESFLRAVTFADHTRDRVIVGGHMFSLYDRTVLHAYGETIDRERWFWGPAPNTFHGHNFGVEPLRRTPWLHRRVDVDYNGWWMCLVPLDVMRKVGLPLPMFIKWDDAEWGLRAKELGFTTVSLPGVAVWHMPWHEKDDTIDWQAYFHERNRLLSGLLHSPHPRGGRLIVESLECSVRHLLAMQYSAAELVLKAIEDLMAGPQHMHANLATILPEIRRLRQVSIDAQQAPSLESYPPVRGRELRPAAKLQAPPHGRLGMHRERAKSIVRHFLPLPDNAKSHPQAIVPHVDQVWWRLARFDSALVSSADGRGASWYQRDPKRYQEMLTRALRLHAKLYRDWPRLRQVYRSAADGLIAATEWERTFSLPPEPLPQPPAMSTEYALLAPRPAVRTNGTRSLVRPPSQRVARD